MEPRKVGHFEILESLGTGAMGVVYLARDTRLKRRVALKLIRPELTEDHTTRGRFVRECQAAAGVSHPGIATIYEAGETEDGRLYFASEWIQGVSLQQRIAAGRLDPDEVIDLGIQLADALAAAHEAGIVHRDVKPANLMIQPDGRLKILDFGLARLLGATGDDVVEADAIETATRTRAGVVVGTPAYMAPEQATGGSVDRRVDIFSSGSVLYVAATGREAFLSDSIPETLRRIIAEDPPPLESLAPAAPPALADVIRKAMAKDPEQRFASAAEMAAALRALKQERSVDSVETVTDRAATAATRRGRRPWLAVGLGLAVIAVVVALVMLVRDRGSREPLEFESRDRLLIANVDNQTGDEGFDLALRTALEADLQQSRYATVYDRNQVAGTLELMRLDPSTPIDEKLGRDVCRFAGIRALILPRILSVGEAYELQAIIVDPTTGRHVDRVRVSARGREEVLLEAIDELSREVRKRLGESLPEIHAADQPVARVTTSSWEALRYLALGNAMWEEGKPREAAAMFELALEKDPQFVTAKGSLGLLLIQFLGQPERGKELLDQALVEAEGLPEREYLLVKAVHRQFVDQDYEGALEEYALISELFPDLMQPYNNSGRILTAQGRYDEAVEMYERSHRVEPTGAVPLLNLYWLWLNSLLRPDEAERVARELLELAPDLVGYRTMLAWSLMCQDRFEEAIAELRIVLEQAPRDPYALPNLAHALYVTGRPQEAVEFYRRQKRLIEDGSIDGSRAAAARDLSLALKASGEATEASEIAATELDRQRADEELERPSDYLLLSQLAVLAGERDRARSLLERARTLGIDDSQAELRLAELEALMDGPEEARAALVRAFRDGVQDPWIPWITPPLVPVRGFRDEVFARLSGETGR